MLTAALVAASVALSDGRLVYSLDDAYIHLSVAESILAGGYGVNPGEHAAPSSSILYPLLLALTEAAGLGTLGPLVLNLAAMLLAVVVVGRILRDHVLTDALLAGARRPLVARLALGLACCVVMNAFGLVMTGMEHSLQVLLAVTVLWRLARPELAQAQPQRRIDPMLVVAAAAMPLVRFEGLALAAATVLALLWLRRFTAAAVVAGAIAAALAAWALFTQRYGLPFLPSSVLSKSELTARIVEQHGVKAFVKAFAYNLRTSLLDRQGALLTLGAMLALLGAVRAYGGREAGAGERWRARAALGGVAAVMALGHVALGRFGWFSRYEVYAMASVVLVVLVLGRAMLARVDARAAAVVALLVVGAPYAVTTAETPWAARGTHDQQYQMHRFVVEHWRRPIAANDLGWLTYRNPHYVLDLWGLGSEEARRMMRDGTMDAAGMGALVRARGIDLAMVYHRLLLRQVPEGWVRVAVMRGRVVTGADSDVGFYATSAAHAAELRALLSEFAPTLPARVTLELEPEATEVE